jgi:NTP pyrophosphatase (non-canonical NTP hydrolase)
VTLNEMATAAMAQSVKSGFHERPREVPELLCLIHSEVSEALEAWRIRGLDAWLGTGGKPEGVASELADVIIRIGDMAARYEIDLDAAVAEKMAFNATRPHKHGKRA